MTKSLTPAQKKKFLPELYGRDGGLRCYYCSVELKLDYHYFDHLNCNTDDDRIENLVLTCQSCNVKRITDVKLLRIGLEKLKENENRLFMRENFDNSKEPPVSQEIDINIKNTKITEQFVYDTIRDKGCISFSDALNACVYICQRDTGHGSHPSVRNYLAALTSIVGPFEIIGRGKKKLIVTRTLTILENNTPSINEDTIESETKNYLDEFI
jgi:hypothetical protein